MNRYYYGNLETSFKLNSGLWEEQNDTDGEEKKGAKKWMVFLKDPYTFTKKLGKKQSGYLESTPAEIDSFLRNNLKDPNRDGDLTENVLLIRLEAPTSEFDLKDQPGMKSKLSLKQDQHLHSVWMACLITFINDVPNTFVSFGS